jgi:hypothetical protein
MEQEPTNKEEFDINKVEPFKVVIVLGTIVITCLLILAFYGGALYSCLPFGGTLTPTAKCYTKQMIDDLNKNQPEFDKNGMKVFENFTNG